MKSIIVGTALAVTLAWGAQATTYHEQMQLDINPISETDFEVIEPNSSTPRLFWCGAANYIEVRTNRSELTPIYLKAPRGPSKTVPGRKSVVFSTSDEGLPTAPSMLTVDVTTPGQMIKSYQARSYCRDAFTRATK